jgi:predicted GNAT family N-acyltransferase
LFDGSTPEAAAAAFENSVFAEVCLNEHSVIGYINCNTPRLISVVVVDPSVHRSGIGSRLLRRALEHISKVAPDASIVEVNATDFSMPFYRRHSFYPISEPFDYEGRRLVRMALWRRNPRPP